ncbi:MAG TPA: phytanoyl-CoA dioxygenase family protein [Planctomycetota bacterium]|nr:phytanoyl-CoA dioxygenase family protein [Planctomycetota bacterium]
MSTAPDQADAIDRALDHLAEHGWVIVPQALTRAEVERLRERLRHARAMGWEEGLNDVGNMWFDSLLEREPADFAPLVGHRSIRPHLDRLLGPQCQLRSLRAHLNPGAYTQEWHLDFYGYWHERRNLARHRLAVPAVGINTTFYLQDNDPGFGRLTFVRGGHLREPPHLHPYDPAAFSRWCEAQPKDQLHPRSGDCVLFFSHIPHQGAKDDPASERGNVVVHYQACPMHAKIWHVSQPRSANVFPLATAPA